MNKIVSITLFSFLILLLILLAFSSTKKTRGEVLQGIDLQGCALLSQSDYLQFANIGSTADLSRYSVATLREKFLEHPYVENAFVVLNADNKVSVKILEKSFEAVVIEKEKLFFVTVKKQFVPVLPDTKMLDFPVLINLSKDGAEKENERMNELQNAFTVIRSAKKLDENFIQSISEINLRNGGDIIVTLTHANSLVLLGKQNLSEKMYSLDVLMKQIGNKIPLTTANYIDLRYDNNVFIGVNGNTGI